MIKLLDILREIQGEIQGIFISKRSLEERKQNHLAITEKKIKQYIKKDSQDDLDLSDSPIQSLFNNLKVEGNLDLRGTRLSKKYTKEQIKEMVSDLIENIKLANKNYVESGDMNAAELEQLIEIDPTPTHKYVFWMAKQWVDKTVTDIDDLRNTIEEYNTFLNKGKAKTRDINQFKSFKDLKKEVNDLNDSGASISVKDLESDYETIIDNENLLIIVPHTHEASRKLGLSQFTFRDCGDGKKDSAWCTTFKSPEHFNDYYYNRGVTFYYIKVKPEAKEIINKLKEKFPQRWKSLIVTALAVLPKGQIDGYDGLDKQISKKDINTFTNIVGIS